MKTIKSLEKEGYIGIDANLATSLLEYNLIWTKTKQCTPNEYHCIYKLQDGKHSNGYLDLNGIISELQDGWLVEWFKEHCDLDRVEFIQSLKDGNMYSFYTIFSYYGYMEFFGSPDYTIYIYDDDELESMLNSELHFPSGSGIDCSYNYTMYDNRVTIENSYHCMNEAGYYDGYIPFKVTIHFSDPLDCKLQFTDYTYNRNAIRKYGTAIRDYLYDTYMYFVNNNVDMFLLV